jgi:murein peptide amidase A
MAAAEAPVGNPRRSLVDVLTPLDRLAATLAGLLTHDHARFEREGESYVLPRYSFAGPPGGGEPIRIGLFGGLHGDEPASVFGLVRFVDQLERYPEIVRGYHLSIYPVCNLTGFADGTRHSRSGKDLNREFWRGSAEPEVRLLEHQLTANRFDGLIALHSDDTSDGLYGFTSGALFTEELLRPALRAAEQFLPVNQRAVIDGFDARQGICRQGYEGVLSAPPDARPRPFEIVFETPQHAPEELQEHAFVAALEAMLLEYRRFIAYGADL